MKFRSADGSGFFCSDNRESGGAKIEDDVLGCVHCFAAIQRRDVEKPKLGITLRARCFACDGYLCPECGLVTSIYGHAHPDHIRAWPHHLWIQRSIDEIYRREQNAKLGV